MMRTFLKFAVLAAGMILLLATVTWVQFNVGDQNWGYWNIDEQVQWAVFITLLATSIAVVVLLARERIQRGRILGIVLATGLLVTTLLGVGMSLLELATLIPLPILVVADPLAFCFALGLVVVLAETRRWKLLWLGMAALAGTQILVNRLVGLGLSFRAYPSRPNQGHFRSQIMAVRQPTGIGSYVTEVTKAQSAANTAVSEQDSRGPTDRAWASFVSGTCSRPLRIQPAIIRV
jgi:hypothetical protein